MPTRDVAWPQGTPCWVECQVDDPAKAAEFYAALFGLDIEDTPPEAGGYRLAVKNGKRAAGITPKQDPNTPSAWLTYIAVDDAAVSANKVASTGGKVLVPAFDVMDIGRMAVVTDSHGAVFCLWQAGTVIGAEVFDEPGTWTWNELHTDAVYDTRAFYTQVFGYSFSASPRPYKQYSAFQVGGESVGGFYHDRNLPEGHPPYWLVWFATSDTDATVAKVVELGGTVASEPVEGPFGHMAVVRGPQGEHFGVINTARKTSMPTRLDFQ